MSIKRMLLLIYAVTFLLLIAIVLSITLLYNNHQQLSKSEEERYKSYLLADELRQSSDDLTRLARTYVVTGDVKWENMYWEILDIRNGKKPRPQNYERIYWDLAAKGGLKPRPDGEAVPLQTLMKQAGFTDAEFKKLAQAQANSDGLVKTEDIAMKAIKRNVDSDAQKLMMPGETNQEFAIRIMHDDKYHQDKAAIMKPIDEFFEIMENRTKSKVEHYSKLQQMYLETCIGAIVLLVIVIEKCN